MTCSRFIRSSWGAWSARASSLPTPTITLVTQSELTRQEAIDALNEVFLLNGITMINVGEKFVKAVAAAESGANGALIHTNEDANYPEIVAKMQTHVMVQLKYARIGPTCSRPSNRLPRFPIPLCPSRPAGCWCSAITAKTCSGCWK